MCGSSYLRHTKMIDCLIFDFIIAQDTHSVKRIEIQMEELKVSSVKVRASMKF